MTAFGQCKVGIDGIKPRTRTEATHTKPRRGAKAGNVQDQHNSLSQSFNQTLPPSCSCTLTHAYRPMHTLTGTETQANSFGHTDRSIDSNTCMQEGRCAGVWVHRPEGVQVHMCAAAQECSCACVQVYNSSSVEAKPG